MDPKTKKSKLAKLKQFFYILCSQTFKLIIKYRIILGLILYLYLTVIFCIYKLRYITLGCLIATCILFKPAFLRYIMLTFSFVFICAVYLEETTQNGYSIRRFLGLTEKAEKPIKFKDEFIDNQGYCYFAFQNEIRNHNELFWYLENYEEIGHTKNADEFFLEYFDVTGTLQNIGLYLKNGSKKFFVGYDKKSIRPIEKSRNIFADNILPYKVFETVDMIDIEVMPDHKGIMCFNVPRSSDLYKEYKKIAVENNVKGIWFLAEQFFKSTVGYNNNSTVFIFSIKEKRMKKMRITYEPKFVHELE